MDDTLDAGLAARQVLSNNLAWGGGRTIGADVHVGEWVATKGRRSGKALAQ